MPTQACIFYHLRLYNYWLGRRGSRLMPARGDIDPGEISVLLPYLIIIDRTGDQFRYRLMGTAVVRELGHDLTGTIVGSYLGDTRSAEKLRAVYERVFTKALPVFASGMFQIRTGAIHNVSLLALPLSPDGTHVNMTVAALIARFNFELAASRDWLKGKPLKVCNIADVP
jgi:hypothetical protein